MAHMTLQGQPMVSLYVMLILMKAYNSHILDFLAPKQNQTKNQKQN